MDLPDGAAGFGLVAEGPEALAGAAFPAAAASVFG